MGCAMIPPPPALELEAPAVSRTTGQAGTAPEPGSGAGVPSSADNIFISRSRSRKSACLAAHSAVWLYGLPRRFTPGLSSSHALHPGVGSQPASGLAAGPSINQGTKFIASYSSLSHFSVSVHLLVVLALIAPTPVPTRCSLVLVDLPNQMPRSHDEPNLPSWTPDSFARTASAKLSKGL